MVKPDDVRAILLRHFRPAGMGRRVSAAVLRLLERLYTDEAWTPVTRYAVDLRIGPDATYTARQRYLASEGAGERDPLSLDDYIAHGGFEALKKCLGAWTPDRVLDEIVRSGLRGRGGGGYHTGQKWKLTKQRSSDVKYIICNGDEGDPGAFMNRMILESFPFRTIEGMTIASYVVGAHEGVLYVRAEYPLAVARVRQALRICQERGLVGDNILGSGHSLHLRVAVGAGAFVCGEETALMRAVEGKRGMPTFRPPFPAERGLWGKPTLINNVETYSLVPWIVRHGADAFAAMGTETSKGTKTFALAGKVRRGGMIEVPMGITLREIVEEIGGGISDDRKLKAVQVGGPSGGCVPGRLANTSVDYHALTTVGAMMGSGGMVVLDERDCMVDIARYFLTFTQRESCGKCTFCRIGTKRMLEILERLCAGEGQHGDIEKLERLARAIKDGSLCGLGKTAPNPVLSTITYFREEYEAHVAGHCPARQCKKLIRYVVGDKCIGCTRCAQQCPVGAIEARPYRQHEIDVEKCTRCDACRVVCPVETITIESLDRPRPGPAAPVKK
jgi:NADH-quinone oxidoreductase subunit F